MTGKGMVEGTNVAELSDAELAQLEIYFKDAKKALKTHSKNELIRMVAALLVNQHILTESLKRLTTPSGKE